MNDYEWYKICKAFCEQKLNAKLLFANALNLDFGCEYEDGTFRHYDVHFMEDYLKGEY